MKVARSTAIAVFAAAAVLAVPSLSSAAARPSTTTVAWNGNGTTYDGSSRALTSVICSPTAGAESTGNYLLFVLSSTKGFTSTPRIQFGSGAAVSMTKSNQNTRGTGSYKYVLTTDTTFDLQALLTTGVYASNFGSASPSFVVSHGCNASGDTSPLTIVFAGEASGAGFVNLGDTMGGTVLQFCQSDALSNCVSFDSINTITPGTSRTLTLTDVNAHALAFTPIGIGFCQVDTYATSPTALAAYTQVGKVESLSAAGTTTSTFSNGNTIYITHRCEVV